MKKIRTQPRLVSLIREIGGMNVAQALKAAEETLGKMREAGLAGIDQALDTLDLLIIDWPLTRDELYDAATAIIDVSGIAHELDVAQAAKSLCDLLDSDTENRRHHVDAVRLHISSMRLLHRSAADPPARQAILRALAKLSTHVAHDGSMASVSPA